MQNVFLIASSLKNIMNKKNKILLLSNDSDSSTSKVIRWLNYLDNSIDVIRLHLSDLANAHIYQKDIMCPLQIGTPFTFDTNEVSVVWTRKYSILNIDGIIIDKSISDNDKKDIIQNLKNEWDTFLDYFYFQIEQNNSYWLNKPCYSAPNKLQQLYVANQIGFNTPTSILSTNKNDIEIPQDLITKPLSDSIFVDISGSNYLSYTSRVSKEQLEREYFISLFQEEIQKEIELRVFYLDGQCHTIAIMSQNNKQTEVDYRQYDHEKMNRNELYKLPINIEYLVIKFMKRMNLQTGSLDLILDKNGNYIFLEVNPSGQYDIFNCCNIYPDKLIAEHLIEKYHEYKG